MPLAASLYFSSRSNRGRGLGDLQIEGCEAQARQCGQWAQWAGPRAKSKSVDSKYLGTAQLHRPQTCVADPASMRSTKRLNGSEEIFAAFDRFRYRVVSLGIQPNGFEFDSHSFLLLRTDRVSEPSCSKELLPPEWRIYPVTGFGGTFFRHHPSLPSQLAVAFLPGVLVRHLPPQALTPSRIFRTIAPEWKKKSKPSPKPRPATISQPSSNPPHNLVVRRWTINPPVFPRPIRFIVTCQSHRPAGTNI